MRTGATVFPSEAWRRFRSGQGGVISAGGVGFDISCGVRTLRTGLSIDEVEPRRAALADALFRAVPCGVGSTGPLRLSASELDDLMLSGARWSVQKGFGRAVDLETIEEEGVMAGAEPAAVSPEAKKRQRDQLGTLGSGNHYLEVQEVVEIFAPEIAAAYQLRAGEVVVSIHCGSRGLGHQIGTDYLKSMLAETGRHGIELPERELACAPIDSALGQRYLGRYARGHELRHGQPSGHRPPGARDVLRDLPQRRADAALRRFPQHLQRGRA